MTPTTTPEGFQAPLIHLNGTGGETLVREYENARNAVINAVRACRLVTINPRDYYPINPDAYDKARKEFCQQMAKLDEVIAYLEPIMICVQDQQQERESRRSDASRS